MKNSSPLTKRVEVLSDNYNMVTVQRQRSRLTMHQIMRRAMQAPDNLVVELDYADSKGIQTRRVISPIRFLSSKRVLGLCLCREAPRQFYLDRCANIELKPAADYVMPVPINYDGKSL